MLLLIMTFASYVVVRTWDNLGYLCTSVKHLPQSVVFHLEPAISALQLLNLPCSFAADDPGRLAVLNLAVVALRQHVSHPLQRVQGDCVKVNGEKTDYEFSLLNSGASFTNFLFVFVLYVFNYFTFVSYRMARMFLFITLL